MSVKRQFTRYFFVGAVASAAHYIVLIALVEGARWQAVPATLCGYLIGGVIAYVLNYRLTFNARLSHRLAAWRFALTAFGGFCLTYVLMTLFVESWGAPYLMAQLVTSALAMVMTFTLNRLWTFG